MTKEEFVKEAIKIHGNRYDCSKVEFLGVKKKVCIICPIHGEFWQVAYSHLKGHGCSKCAGVGRLTTEEFVQRAKQVHGDKYDYSKTEYVNANTNVCIICPEHGEFWQKPFNHLNGADCKYCKKPVWDTESFIRKAREVHGDKYDYSKAEYKGSYEKITITCPEHGDFEQVANYHLCGNGCPKCGTRKLWDNRGRITTEEFVQRAKQVHGDKYDYSKTEYVNARTKVCIICHKKNRNGIEHGEFWQTPKEHIHGRGCPKCRNSYLERTISIFLEENGIKYFKEKTFPWLRKNKNSPLFLDFYLPDYNVAIECQGVQHFVPIKNNVDKFEKIKFNDRFKKEKCEENGIKLLYFSHEIISKNYTNEYIIFNKDELLNKIRNA